jgi:hypothetical protein
MRDIGDEGSMLSPSSRGSEAASLGAGTLLLLRILSAALSVSFAILLFITIDREGSPFYWSVLEAKWMRTTLVDYYLTLAPLCLFAGWRERRNPMWAAATILYFCCLGSTAVWSYVFLVFSRLRAGDAVSKILA